MALIQRWGLAHRVFCSSNFVIERMQARVMVNGQHLGTVQVGWEEVWRYLLGSDCGRVQHSLGGASLPMQGGRYWWKWGISHSPTNTKIKCYVSAGRLFQPPTWWFSFTSVKKEYCLRKENLAEGGANRACFGQIFQ